jgi:hypothetical protein
MAVGKNGDRDAKLFSEFMGPSKESMLFSKISLRTSYKPER